MVETAKPKYQVLQEFTAIIYKHNPIGIKPLPPDEYEAEALSILSRFCEGALQVADNPEAIVQFASETVRQTFNFWFADILNDFDFEPLIGELLKTYIDSFPAPQIEQPVMKEEVE